MGSSPVEVVAMSLDAGPRTTSTHRFSVWARVAIALTPVMWVATALEGFATDGGGEDRTVVRALASLLVNAVVLAAPTAAVALGIAARRAGEPSGPPARTVALVLFVLTVVLVPLLVTSFSVTWLVAVSAALLVLWLAWQRGGSPRPGSPGAAGGAPR